MADMRDNLLVTMAVRAGHMNALNYIDLPHGMEGEDIVADFCVSAVNLWNKLKASYGQFDMTFDDFAELTLTNGFPPASP